MMKAWRVVPVIVVADTHTPLDAVELSRVPCTGELLRLRRGVVWDDFLVRGVRHLPADAGDGTAADVFVEPVGRREAQ